MTKKQLSKWLEAFGDWFFDLGSHRIFLALPCFLLGLVIAKGGPLTLTFSDGTEFTMLDTMKPNELLSKLLILTGFLELADINLVTSIVGRILRPILNPIIGGVLKPALKPVGMALYSNPTIKRWIDNISTYLAKTSDKESEEEENEEGNED